MKRTNCDFSAAGSFYYFTQVRFAGRYYRAAGRKDRPVWGNQIR